MAALARFTMVFALVAASLAAGVAHAAEPFRFPDDEPGRRMAAWLRAYRSANVDTLAAFFREHVSPAALAERPAEARAARHREIHSDLGPLSPLRVDVGDDGMRVLVCRAANGDEASVEFGFEPEAPHRIVTFGIRVEAGGGGPPPAAAVPDPPAEERATVAAIRATMDSLAARGFSGVVRIARGDRLLLESAWGLADRKSSRPNRTSTRFNLGSINKVFTQVAIAQLAESGRLKLDDTIERWIPELPRDIASRITVRHLIHHRSGLGDFFGPRFESADRAKLLTNADYLPLFADLPLEFEPGARQRYSNAGYVVLGLIVERVSGEPYHDYIRRHVYAPAGMKDTDSYALSDVVPDRAVGYTSRGAGDAVSDNLGMLPGRGSAAGGGWSTAADLERFVKSLGGGKLLGPAWSAWITRGPEPGAGADGAKAPPPGSLGLAGGSPGVNALLDASFDPPWVVIVLANGDPPMAEAAGQMFSRWVDRLGRR